MAEGRLACHGTGQLMTWEAAWYCPCPVRLKVASYHRCDLGLAG
jgi:hypothetical protein